MEDVNAYLIERFGMTADAIVRVMRNHKRIVNSEVHETSGMGSALEAMELIGAERTDV